MKRIFFTFLCCLMMVALVPAEAKTEKKVAVFQVEIHCQGCIDKIEKNIAFEKGVKDLRCDLKTQTVTVTYDPQRTDKEKLKQAFEKIKKPVLKDLTDEKTAK